MSMCMVSIFPSMYAQELFVVAYMLGQYCTTCTVGCAKHMQVWERLWCLGWAMLLHLWPYSPPKMNTTTPTATNMMVGMDLTCFRCTIMYYLLWGIASQSMWVHIYLVQNCSHLRILVAQRTWESIYIYIRVCDFLLKNNHTRGWAQ